MNLSIYVHTIIFNRFALYAHICIYALSNMITCQITIQSVKKIPFVKRPQRCNQRTPLPVPTKSFNKNSFIQNCKLFCQNAYILVQFHWVIKPFQIHLFKFSTFRNICAMQFNRMWFQGRYCFNGINHILLFFKGQTIHQMHANFNTK